MESDLNGQEKQESDLNGQEKQIQSSYIQLLAATRAIHFQLKSSENWHV